MGLLERLKAMTPPRPPAWLKTAINLFGHRQRRTWSDGSRAHIELRALDPPQFARFALDNLRHVALGGHHLRHQVARQLQQALAGGGEAQRAGFALEKRRFVIIFERADLVR